jgi:hypothetical protein
VYILKIEVISTNKVIAPERKKKVLAAELFYSRKNFFLFAKELFSIRERTLGHRMLLREKKSV